MRCEEQRETRNMEVPYTLNWFNVKLRNRSYLFLRGGDEADLTAREGGLELAVAVPAQELRESSPELLQLLLLLLATKLLLLPLPE